MESKPAGGALKGSLCAPSPAVRYAVWLCSALLLDRLHTACKLCQRSTSLPRSLLLRAVGLRARSLLAPFEARQGKAGRPDTAMRARNCCSAASCSGGGQRAVKCLCSQIDRSLRPQVAQACPRFSQRRASAARDHLGLGCDSFRARARVRCCLARCACDVCCKEDRWRQDLAQSTFDLRAQSSSGRVTGARYLGSNACETRIRIMPGGIR